VSQYKEFIFLQVGPNWSQYEITELLDRLRTDFPEYLWICLKPGIDVSIHQGIRNEIGRAVSEYMKNNPPGPP